MRRLFRTLMWICLICLWSLTSWWEVRDLWKAHRVHKARLVKDKRRRV